jgi:hypothetical protein
VGLLVELVDEHRQGLGRVPTEAPDLPDAPPLLDDNSSSLRDIARYLTTPSATGALLTRDDIAALGRQLGVPRGFGSRTDMLESLLRNAAEYGSSEELLKRTSQLFSDKDSALGNLTARFELFAAWVAPWRRRIAHTRSDLHVMLARMSQADLPIG